jgi:hypothetical protein
MIDETDDSASPIIKKLLSAFEGDTRPATLEDVARVYSRILEIADVLVNLLEVAGTSREKKLAAIDQFQEKFYKISHGLGEDLKTLMEKSRGVDNG